MADIDHDVWLDFVRGLLASGEHEALERELARASKPLRRQVELLHLLTTVGQAETQLVIPEHAVRGAKALGSLRRSPVSRPGRLRFLTPSLIFDSFGQAALAGTRNLQHADRQVAYEAGPFSVHLRIEQEGVRRNTVVVGQIQQRQPPTPIRSTPIIVADATRLIDTSITSQFGEFHLEQLPELPLDLFILLHDLECIRIPLVDPAHDPEDPAAKALDSEGPRRSDEALGPKEEPDR